MAVQILTDEDKKVIVDTFQTHGLYKGFYDDMSMAFSVSRKTIKRVLIEHGLIENTWRKRLCLTDEEYRMIRYMRQTGASSSELIRSHMNRVGAAA